MITGLASGYRYGFNGKENDNEVKGEGGQQDYGLRIYDPRIGKFLSVDPLTKGYPSWSPYPFAMSSPISGIDLDGGEFLFYATKQVQENGNTKLTVTGGPITQRDPNLIVTAKLAILNSPGGSELAVRKDFKIPISSIGLKANFVNQNGEWVRVPDEYDLNDLPSPSD